LVSTVPPSPWSEVPVEGRLCTEIAASTAAYRSSVDRDENKTVAANNNNKHQKPEKSLFLRTWWCNKVKNIFS
jgi:hypothetical protein